MLAMKDTGLVAGVPLEKTPLTAVKALRGFVDEHGQTHAKGDTVMVSERFARSIIAANKAERAAPAPKAAQPAAPAPAQSKAEPSQKYRRKERDED